MNSTFRARWLASSEVISQVLFTSEQPTKNKMAFVGVIVKNKVALWAASYSACVVYTKTIFHLSVGESGGYLPSRRGEVNIHHYSPPLRWIIVNNWFRIPVWLIEIASDVILQQCLMRIQINSKRVIYWKKLKVLWKSIVEYIVFKTPTRKWIHTTKQIRIRMLYFFFLLKPYFLKRIYIQVWKILLECSLIYDVSKNNRVRCRHISWTVLWVNSSAVGCSRRLVSLAHKHIHDIRRRSRVLIIGAFSQEIVPLSTLQLLNISSSHTATLWPLQYWLGKLWDNFTKWI